MRHAVAAAAGVAVFAGAYGLAASLGLTTDSLGAGTSVVAACQSQSMKATYASSYSQSTPGYQTTTVTVTGLQSSCYSMPYRLTLSDGSNNSLGEATGTTPSSGTSFSASITSSAAAVAGVALVISG